MKKQMTWFGISIIAIIVIGASTQLAAKSIKRDPFSEKQTKFRWSDNKSLFKKQAGIDDETAEMHIKLTGIISEADQTYVVISLDGKSGIYRVDDNLVDIEITKIFSDHILLKRKNKTYILELGKEIIL